MGRLELGLGLEVLGLKVVPRLKENTTREGYKTKKVFCLIKLRFFCFFVLHLFFILPLLLLVLCLALLFTFH